MADYPNNSDAAKQQKDPPIVSDDNKVRKRKESKAKKWLDIFKPDDIRKVRSYAWTDIIVPAIKTTTLNVLSAFIMNGTPYYRPPYDPNGYSGYNSFNKYNNPGNVAYNNMFQQQQPTKNQVSHKVYDYQNIEFDDYNDAVNTLTRLRSHIAQFGRATVADLYDAARQIPRDVDNNYGWTKEYNLDFARVVATTSSAGPQQVFIIELPKAKPLN